MAAKCLYEPLGFCPVCSELVTGYEYPQEPNPIATGRLYSAHIRILPCGHKPIRYTLTDGKFVGGSCTDIEVTLP